MRIAGFIRLWPSHRGVGGMQGHALNLYSGLAARGHDVHVLTTYHEKKPAVEVEQGVTVHYLKGCPPAVYSNEYFDAASKTLDELNQQKKVDVIHSESDCARRHLGGLIPVVVTWHGIAYCSYRSRLNLALLDSNKTAHVIELQKTSENIIREMGVIPRYDHSIAISHQAYNDLNNVYGIPASKLSLVFNGFDIKAFDIFPNARQAIVAQYKLPNDAIILGVVGRIVPDKGHRQLMAIISKLVALNRKIFLLIVGEGGLVHDYIRLGLKNIIYVGPKQYSEMPNYYNAFDVFLNPTTRYLGLDMSIQEAMLCGTPVVASNVGSIRESLLPAREYGTTFTLGDSDDMVNKIMMIINHPERKKLGLAGRQYVKQFCSIEQMCVGTENAFATAIGAKR